MSIVGQSQLSYSHWLSMALSLPEEGVATRFPDEEARIERLVEVRWPHGPKCYLCSGASITKIETRSLFQCQRCRNQFSITSGSLLHGTRLPLGIWFQATESLILYRANIFFGYHIPAQALAQKVGVSYVAARRIRKIVLADIENDKQKLLLHAVCVRD